MILLTHIVIALSSLMLTTYAFFRPAKSKLAASYALVALTLISGTYLVLSTHANMVQSCTSGLVYLVVVSSGVLAAHRRLAAQATRDRQS